MHRSTSSCGGILGMVASSAFSFEGWFQRTAPVNAEHISERGVLPRRTIRRSLRETARQNPHVSGPAAGNQAPEFFRRERQIVVADTRPARTEKLLDPTPQPPHPN